MKWLAMFVLACLGFAAQAREAVPMADDEAVEQRLIGIAEELRCLVCQNESLAGSHAELAQDLRREIRNLIKQGKSDAEVMEFLVSRYGDFVRYRPPLKPTTWLLWGGPFIFTVVAVGGLIVYLKRRRSNGASTLTSEEAARAESLLAGDH